MKAKELFEEIISQITIYEAQEAREIVFWLMEHELGLTKIDVLTNKALPDQQINWQNIIARINNHEPIQYILGETTFYGRKFLVSPAVLIPRPETEELVGLVVSCQLSVVGNFISETPATQSLYPKSKNQNPKILDIGTGSGCIAISLAKELPESEIFAWDISEKALEIAQKNAILNDVKVTFEKRDILAVSSQQSIIEKFDIIVSNPPYVTKNEAFAMKQNVLDFEPHLALFVENYEPLVFYEAIANFAHNNLIINGLVFLEINENYGKETAEVLKKYDFSDIEIIKDINQKERFVKAVKGVNLEKMAI